MGNSIIIPLSSICSIIAENVIVYVVGPASGRRLLNCKTMNIHVVAARVLVRLQATLLGVQVV